MRENQKIRTERRENKEAEFEGMQCYGRVELWGGGGGGEIKQ